MIAATQMDMIDINELVPYVNNARTHSEDQILKLRASLREFGFVNPVLIDSKNNIISGHGRVMAAKAEGFTEVPCVLIEHLTLAQKKAYILADNRLAIDAGWDEELLRTEFENLSELGFDLELMGFSDSELNFDIGQDPDEDPYTDKVGAPQYEITGAQPLITDLMDQGKYFQLLEDIEASEVSDIEKFFLRQSASRHIVFDYGSIAEYYANADPEMQRLMEASALVIIDFDDAIAGGYVALSTDIKQMFEEDDENDG